MLRNLLPLICYLVLPSLSYSQQIKLKINAVPEKTVVVVNNDTIGETGQRVLYLGFNDRKGIDTHQVVFFADGYRSEEYTFTSESDRVNWLDIRLMRDVPALDESPNYLVDWRNVVSGIPYGTDLGVGTRWLYRFNTGVLDIKAREELHQALSLMNLNLFDDLPDARSRLENGDSARYMLHGIVESYRLQRGMKSQDYASYYKSYTATVSVRWRVYDRELDSLLLDEPYASTYEYRGTATFGFHDAVVDNFYHYAQALNSLISLFENIDKPEVNTRYDRFEEADGDENTVLDLNGEVSPADTLPMPASLSPLADTLSNFADSTVTNSPSMLSDTITISTKAEIVEPLNNKESLSTKNKTVLQVNKEATNKKSLASTIVFVVDSKGETIGSGAVLSKDGLAIAHLPSSTLQSVKLRFVNGVELDAEQIQFQDNEGLALLKIINTTRLTSVRIAMNAAGEDVWLATMDRDETVGVNWQRYQEGEIKMDNTNLPNGTPVFNSSNELIGLITKNSVGSALNWFDAKQLMNVFGLTYE